MGCCVKHGRAVGIPCSSRDAKCGNELSPGRGHRRSQNPDGGGGGGGEEDQCYESGANFDRTIISSTKRTSAWTCNGQY